MKVLIIEDEAPAARRLQQLLLDQFKSITILGILDSVDASVKWLTDHASPDLIFMDIQLADGLSFDIFRQVTVQAPVIFTTAYDEYALRAFKVNSIDYLLKPVDKAALAESLQKWQQLKEVFTDSVHQETIRTIVQSLKPGDTQYKSRFLVKLGDRLLFIAATDIAYFIADEKLVCLVTAENKKYATDYSLDELEALLQPSTFFRANRQFIIQIQSIKNIHNYFNGKLKLTLQPMPTQEVLVSRERASLFKRWLDS